MTDSVTKTPLKEDGEQQVYSISAGGGDNSSVGFTTITACFDATNVTIRHANSVGVNQVTLTHPELETLVASYQAYRQCQVA